MMVVVTNLGNISYLVKTMKYNYEKAVMLFEIITNHSSTAISRSESLQYEFLHSQEQPLHYL